MRKNILALFCLASLSLIGLTGCGGAPQRTSAPSERYTIRWINMDGTRETVTVEAYSLSGSFIWFTDPKTGKTRVIGSNRLEITEN